MKNLMQKIILISILHFCSCLNAQGKTIPSNNPDQQLQKLGITLPEPSSPVANYVKYVQSGNLLYLSGTGPLKSDGTLIKGKLGADLTIEQGYEAARITAINLIATLKSATGGDLNKVTRIVKVLGMVNATPDFNDAPKVINGFSDLVVEIFGERGRHARSAIGVASLPSGIAVEIELIVEVE
jgi:enamine deaminase RidA (YjgF/YER057c/UK114 family)